MATGGTFEGAYESRYVPQRARTSNETEDFFVWNKDPHLDFKPKKSILPKPWSVVDSMNYVESLKKRVEKLQSENLQLRSEIQILEEMKRKSETNCNGGMSAADELQYLSTKFSNFEMQLNAALLLNKKLVQELNNKTSSLLSLKEMVCERERNNTVVHYGIGILRSGIRKHEAKLPDIKMVLQKLKDLYMLLCNYFRPSANWIVNNVDLNCEEGQKLYKLLRQLTEEKEKWIQKANELAWLLEDTEKEKNASKKPDKIIGSRLNEWINGKSEHGSHLPGVIQKQYPSTPESNGQTRIDYCTDDLFVPARGNGYVPVKNTQEQELDKLMKQLAENNEKWIQKANELAWLSEDIEREKTAAKEPDKIIGSQLNEWINGKSEHGSHLTGAIQKQYPLAPESNGQTCTDYYTDDLFVPAKGNNYLPVKNTQEQQVDKWMKQLAEKNKKWIQKANELTWFLEDTEKEKAASKNPEKIIGSRLNEWLNGKLEHGSHLTGAIQKQYPVTPEMNRQTCIDYYTDDPFVPARENRDVPVKNTLSDWYRESELVTRQSSI